MHYPHKISRIKKVRKVGFRARMRTSKVVGSSTAAAGSAVAW